ncbi:MAG: flagellar protein FliS [Pseudomonadota bacterium]|jgi:flagellar secretion chaperone FliS
MFSSATSTPFGRQPPYAQAYRSMAAETGITDASPHRLVLMLYDGLLESLAEARGAMRARDHERKGRAIGRAVRIVEEGLRGGLNLQAGGELAQNLHQLYGYMATRLTQANLRNDEQMLLECQNLLQPLRDAWISISSAPADKHDA